MNPDQRGGGRDAACARRRAPWYVTCEICMKAKLNEVTEIPNPTELRVSVLMERRLATVGQWTQPQWDAVAVVAGEDVSRAPRRTHVHHDDTRDQYLWTGLRMELFKDGCESYWYNLVSDKPRLFVICFEEDGEEESEIELRPILVTANQDEANGHMETDDPVYSVAMPEAVIQLVERFVMTYYEPEIKRKRKRKNWVEDSEYAKTEREQLDRIRRS